MSENKAEYNAEPEPVITLELTLDEARALLAIAKGELAATILEMIERAGNG